MTPQASERKPVLLIDMDGVISDYRGRFVELIKVHYPDVRVRDPEEMHSFYIEDVYTELTERQIFDFTQKKGFFATIPPVEGAIEALKKIEAGGRFEPFLCSAPDADYEELFCHTEKADWVNRHLGKYWLKRMILTNDKTVINGDWLIDDKPEIKGANKNPTWQQVVFDHAYNRHLKEVYRLKNWSDWEHDIGPYLEYVFYRDQEYSPRRRLA